MRNNVKQNKDHRSSRLMLVSHRQKGRLLALMMVGRRPARIYFSLDAELGVGYRPLGGGHDTGIVQQRWQLRQKETS